VEKKEDKIKGKTMFEKVSKDGNYDIEKWMNTKKYYEGLREKDSKTCPECGTELYIDDLGILRELDESIDIEEIDDNLKEIKKIKKYYDNLEEVRSSVKELNQRLKEYEVEPEPPSEEIDVEKIETEIKELSKYEEMEEYDFSGMHRFLDLCECMIKLESHREEDYYEYRYDLPPDDEWAQKYFQAKETYERCKKFMEEYQIMDTETYQKKKGKLETLTEEIEKLVRGKEVLGWCENEQKIKELTKAWADKINSSCKNTTGCTSDLNVYKTAAEAEKQLNGFIQKYNDPNKCFLAKEEF